MVSQMVKFMQLIGALMAVAAATTAVAWYFVLWPLDRGR